MMNQSLHDYEQIRFPFPSTTFKLSHFIRLAIDIAFAMHKVDITTGKYETSKNAVRLGAQMMTTGESP